MHINRIYVDGFKRLVDFELSLNERLNVIVGDNETGKTSILEAINLVLTRHYDGRVIDHSLDPYLFNNMAVAEYFAKLRNGSNASPPQILIEAYFSDSGGMSVLQGTNNSKNEDCAGVKLIVELDQEHVELLKEYAKDTANPEVLPVEFYRCHWRGFSDNPIAHRKLPFKSKAIDTSLPKTYRGPNKYVSQLVSDVLTEQQRRELSLAYKRLRHNFSHQDGVKSINQHLEQQGRPRATRKLTVQVDMSSKSTWDSTIAAHLDDLPFDCAGKGEQCRIQMHLAIVDSGASQILLIEEPENHLSHSNLNLLMDEINQSCSGRQVIVTTHSAFVLNKLGIDHLRLISHAGNTASLNGLTPETIDYFMKLPGYDTLRLVLSRRCILVEGPSDELIVQRAYKDKHGKLPIEDSVDVISVAGLAFKRFLEIAALLKLDVCVVTDNDGDVEALKTKYRDYVTGQHSTIKICYDDNETLNSLEPQLLNANSLALLNTILETKCATNDAMLKTMGGSNKTECALKLFKTEEKWVVPGYIANAIR